MPLNSIALTLPVTFNEPVNLCESSRVSPKIVEPLEKDDVICETEDDTIYLCAIISPEVCMLPVKVIPAKVGEDVVFTVWSKSVRLSATTFPISVPPMDNVFAPTSILPNEPVDVDEALI